MKRFLFLGFWGWGSCGVSTTPSDCADTSCDTSPPPDTEASVSLANDVVPIMASNCGVCHAREGSPSPEAVANSVYFENSQDMLSRVGSLIEPGDSEGSLLISVLRQDVGIGAGPTLMPPPSSARNPMTKTRITVVATWIDDGAPDN